MVKEENVLPPLNPTLLDILSQNNPKTSLIKENLVQLYTAYVSIKVNNWATNFKENGVVYLRTVWHI